MQTNVPTERFTRASIKVALIAVFTGLSLGTNYVLIDLPNVKVMDALVFVSAFMFGLDVGIGVAVFSRLVYAVNPWGTAPVDLLLFLMLGETFYAFAGFLLSKTTIATSLLEGRELRQGGIILGIAGLVSTFAYDVLTNFASYVFVTASLLNALLIGMATGAPLAIVHEVSNLIFFATVAPLAIVAGRRFTLQRRDVYFGK